MIDLGAGEKYLLQKIANRGISGTVTEESILKYLQKMGCQRQGDFIFHNIFPDGRIKFPPKSTYAFLVYVAKYQVRDIEDVIIDCLAIVTESKPAPFAKCQCCGVELTEAQFKKACVDFANEGNYSAIEMLLKSIIKPPLT